MGVRAFTLQQNDEALRYAEFVVNGIRSEILRDTPADNCTAIILTGSFGRGEGGVIYSGGRWGIVNDIEFTVVQETPQPEHMLELSKRLKKKYDIYNVEIGAVSPENITAGSLTISAYDLRYGSTVIYGDENILKKIGEFRPEDIPLWEGATLLLNRGGGLIMHFTLRRHLQREAITDTDRQIMKNQLVKAGVALGDALLVLCGDYHVLYAERHKIFNKLADEKKAAVPDGGYQLINTCYMEKLYPGTNDFGDPFRYYDRLASVYKSIFLTVMSKCYNIALPDVISYSMAMAGNEGTWPRFRRTVLTPAYRSLKAMMREGGGKDGGGIYGSMVGRKTAYACMPLIILSAPFLNDPDREGLAFAESMIFGIWKGRMRGTPYNERWELVRDLCFRKWYRIAH